MGVVLTRSKVFPQESKSSESLERVRLSLEGRVQGVGMRPFVVRLARSLGLTGFVQNAPGRVLLEIQGKKRVLLTFLEKLRSELPEEAAIEGTFQEQMALDRSEEIFSIHPSAEEEAEEESLSALLPDTAVCSDCIRELFDPNNRRFRYPLISCTACGPRYSISLGAPFDRCRTTLHQYPLCSECQREYGDPEDRRFHSQTIGCHSCGPGVWFLEGSGQPTMRKGSLEPAVSVLLSGGVLAIKGMGGYHLACVAGNREAVVRIRTLKNRPEKPLAVMVGSLETLEPLVRLSNGSRRILSSSQRPIVLLPARKRSPLALDMIAPGLDRIGVFLPSTPLQYLLFRASEGLLPPLIMTSANPDGLPIAAGEKDVLEYFRDRVDGFLGHDRVIHESLDDSLILPGRSSIVIRRSRGWVPAAFSVGRKSRALSGPVVLAFGGHQKIAPCRIGSGRAFVFPHLGDLDSPESREQYRTRLLRFIESEPLRPTHLACDLHPDFPSTRLAFEWGERWRIPVIRVQHHHAHVASVLADRRISVPALGLSLDGFGLGPDGTFWGGELLLVSRSGFKRLGHFLPLPLPGGERAFREPWRMGVSALHTIGEGASARAKFKSPLVPEILALLDRPDSSVFPSTSSAGRLFDAAYAILGGRDRLSFEGQGAMELEAWARGRKRQGSSLTERYFRIEDGRLDFRPLIARLSVERSCHEGARLFHETLAFGLGEWVILAGKKTGLSRLILSGGVFQNRLLVGLLRKVLSGTGITLFEPRMVPPNDGGLALGQAWVVWSSLGEKSRLAQEG